MCIYLMTEISHLDKYLNWYPNSEMSESRKSDSSPLCTYKFQVLYPWDSFKQLWLCKCFALFFPYANIFNLFGIFKAKGLGIF